jgi:protein SCO1/2
MRIVFAAVLLLLAAACGQPSTQKFHLTDVTGANFGKALALTDHSGKPRTLADFKGKVVVIFFGFTQCPDVCPTTLAQMGKVVKELGADGNKVQVLFVSVDPERDTPELLKQYTTAFHPSFLGLYGDAEATTRAAKEFKIYVQKQPAKGGGYTVDHSAGTFILDQQGRLRLFAQHGTGAPILLGDIRTLLNAAP